MLTGLFQHIYSVGVAASVIIAVLLALVVFKTNSNKNPLQTLLSFILITFALSSAFNSLIAIYLAKTQPSTHSLSEPFQLLIGPLYFLYLCHLNKKKLSVFKLALHFVPFVVIALFLLLAVSQQFQFSQTNWLAFATYIQVWFYYIICRKLLRKYQVQLKASCSSIDKINEVWIEQSLFALLFGYTALTLVFALNHGLYELPVNKSIAVILSLVSYFIIYKILRRPEIFAQSPLYSTVEHIDSQPIVLEEIRQVADDSDNTKYKKSSLTAEQIQHTYYLLQQHMEKEKPFIDPELNLQSLAKQLQLSAHHLSQVINHDQSSSFYDLINSYRIIEVKKQLIDPRNSERSILAIAFDAGFNSKATFNRIFKNTVQQTPSQYRKSNTKTI
ncbi:helix-turn-helix domain-containing protein [Colwelliaceae bacterium 6471]